MSYIQIQPCKNTKGFSALPAEKMDLDLEEVSKAIQASSEFKDFKLLRFTKVVVIFYNENLDYKLSIFPSGKVLIKGIAEQEEFKAYLDNFRKMILK